MSETAAKTYERWHEFIKMPTAEILNEILTDDVKFHSPFVWKPKEGKLITTAILLAVTKVLRDFCYVREIKNEAHWALEFEAKIGELYLRGVDLIKLNAEGKIVDFEVMIRPANALQAVGAEMGRRLNEEGFIEKLKD